MIHNDDVPFNEEIIGQYPFRPEDKGWPTRNHKREKRRAMVEKEVIRREVLRGIGDVIDERAKGLKDIQTPQTSGGISGSNDERAQQESLRRANRAVERRELGREERNRRRRILGG